MGPVVFLSGRFFLTAVLRRWENGTPKFDFCKLDNVKGLKKLTSLALALHQSEWSNYGLCVVYIEKMELHYGQFSLSHCYQNHSTNKVLNQRDRS